MSKKDTNKTNLSPLFPYYQQLMSLANSQFAEVAAQINKEIHSNMLELSHNNITPTTPQVELAK